MTAIVILAAGSSSRFGSPKQNLQYKGQTLLQKAIGHALLVCETVIVVLGASAEIIKPTIEERQVCIMHNAGWKEGMASSLRLTVHEIQYNYPLVTSILFMLCDQPFANDHLLKQIISEADKTKKGIIASAYNDILGVPALFKLKYYPHLLGLKGSEGAKKILVDFPDDVLTVDFPLGAVDIDTLEDYNLLKG